MLDFSLTAFVSILFLVDPPGTVPAVAVPAAVQAAAARAAAPAGAAPAAAARNNAPAKHPVGPYRVPSLNEP